MPLNNFGLLQSDDKVQTSEYQGQGGRTQITAVLTTATQAYNTIYTVTTGKTFFVTSIILSASVAIEGHALAIAVGAVASEVEVLRRNVNGRAPMDLDLSITPLAFPSASRISFFLATANTSIATLIGWEE